MTQMQQEALNVLAQVMALSPDVRLGQVMAHLGFLGEAHVGKGQSPQPASDATSVSGSPKA